jgi:hypothetical protein
MSKLINTDEWSGKVHSKAEANTDDWSALTNQAYAVDTKSLKLNKETKDALSKKAMNIQRLKDELGGLVEKGVITVEDAEKKVASAIKQEYIASTQSVKAKLERSGFLKPSMAGAVILGGYYLYKKLIVLK